MDFRGFIFFDFFTKWNDGKKHEFFGKIFGHIMKLNKLKASEYNRWKVYKEINLFFIKKLVWGKFFVFNNIVLIG